MLKINPLARRRFLQTAAALSVGFGTRGVFAAALKETPRMTEGPFYPDKLPLDTDNDLIIINEGTKPAGGEITHLAGRVLDLNGKPIRNAAVEIWQVDAAGTYLNTNDTNNSENKDKNFQGYGRFSSDFDGRYYFRTIKPVPYPGRCPHIHVAVSMNGKRLLTTQLFITGHESNQRDGIFRSLGEEAAKLVSCTFDPLKGSEIGELQATADLVLGKTFNENAKTGIQGAIGKPEWQSGPGGARPPGAPGRPPGPPRQP
jgi:protocatechuate 3,4-dioxygenase beta subunit